MEERSFPLIPGSFGNNRFFVTLVVDQIEARYRFKADCLSRVRLKRLNSRSLTETVDRHDLLRLELASFLADDTQRPVFGLIELHFFGFAVVSFDGSVSVLCHTKFEKCLHAMGFADFGFFLARGSAGFGDALEYITVVSESFESFFRKST